MASQRETLIVATKQLVNILNRTIDNAFGQATSSEGFQPFHLIPNIGEPTWTAYWEWMKAIGVSSKQAVEELTAKFPKDDKELSMCMDELNAAEARFSEFAAMLNAIIQKKEDKIIPPDHNTVTLGSDLPGDSEIINIDSGEKTTIGSCFADSPYTLFIFIRHYA